MTVERLINRSEKNMKRINKTATAGLITLMIIALSPAALATLVPDQAQEASDGGSAFYNWISLAQTFTPGTDGTLHHVDLQIQGYSGQATCPATIAIVTTAADVPTATALGTVLNAPLAVGWNSIDFFSQSIALSAGTKYGIVISNTDPNKNTSPTDALRIQWDTNPYAAGILWERSRNAGGGWNPWEPAIFDTSSTPGYADAAFRTYMVPIPEPTAIALLLCPAMVAVLRNKRK